MRVDEYSRARGATLIPALGWWFQKFPDDLYHSVVVVACNLEEECSIAAIRDPRRYIVALRVVRVKCGERCALMDWLDSPPAG